MRRKGQVRVTTTDGPYVHGRRPDMDAARRADVAALRTALSGLTDGATRVRTTQRPECRVTRAAMHDYVKGRLVPSRQRHVEGHLDRCGECTRVFIDVREVSWELRGLGRRLAAADHRGGSHRAPRSSAGART
jgi:hypothetical protein